MSKTYTIPTTAADPDGRCRHRPVPDPRGPRPAGARRQRQAGALERARRELHRHPRTARRRRRQRAGAPTSPLSASSPSGSRSTRESTTVAAKTRRPGARRLRAVGGHDPSVIADMDAVIADVQAAIDGLDEVDLTSQDIAITIGGPREGPLVPLRPPRGEVTDPIPERRSSPRSPMARASPQCRVSYAICVTRPSIIVPKTLGCREASVSLAEDADRLVEAAIGAVARASAVPVVDPPPTTRRGRRPHSGPCSGCQPHGRRACGTRPRRSPPRDPAATPARPNRRADSRRCRRARAAGTASRSDRPRSNRSGRGRRSRARAARSPDPEAGESRDVGVRDQLRVLDRARTRRSRANASRACEFATSPIAWIGAREPRAGRRAS